MKGFHTQKNLFFERLEGGGVRVTKYPDDTNWLAGDDAPSHAPLFVQELDASPWCSVIASMSAGGEQDLRFYAAEQFHKSTGPERRPTREAAEALLYAAQEAHKDLTQVYHAHGAAPGLHDGRVLAVLNGLEDAFDGIPA
jgi:hypothetical protein